MGGCVSIGRHADNHQPYAPPTNLATPNSDDDFKHALFDISSSAEHALFDTVMTDIQEDDTVTRALAIAEQLVIVLRCLQTTGTARADCCQVSERLREWDKCPQGY